MKRKRYHWSRTGQSAISAQAFGEWAERLPDRRPETIVSAAKNPRSVAHSLFEWNDSRAAREFRLLQARLLWASLVIDVVVYRRGKPETIRVRAIVRTSREGDYEPVERAMGVAEKRDFILVQALTQANAWRRRYKALSEFATVFAALDKVERRVKRKAA